MIIVKIKKGDNFQKALKQFKHKVNKSRTLKEYRSRQEFVKPSVIKRNQKQRAKYIQKLKTLEQNG
tara:strand:+ start:404 stop:601 length:198 start_codon:yes stop_codon:yes gene_type:complete